MAISNFNCIALIFHLLSSTCSSVIAVKTLNNNYNNNVPNPTLMTDDIYATSRRSTDILVQAIKSDGVYEIEANVRQQCEIKAEALSKKKKLHIEKYKAIIAGFDSSRQRAIQRA